MISDENRQPLINDSFQEGERSLEEDNMYKEERTYFQRTFGAMQEGSLRGSIFTLCSVTVGSGVLALPYTFTKVGFMLGSIILVIATIASLWS